MDFGEELYLSAQSKPLDIRNSPDDKRPQSSETNFNSPNNSKMVSPPKTNNENEEDLFKTINELYMNVIQQNNNSSANDLNNQLNDNNQNINNNNYQPTTTLDWIPQSERIGEEPNNTIPNKLRRRIKKHKERKYNEHTKQYDESSSSSEETDEDSKESNANEEQKEKEVEKLTNSQEDLVSELKSILENVSFDWRNIKVDHSDKNRKTHNDKPLANGNALNSETSESENDEDDDEEYWHFKIEHNDLHNKRIQGKNKSRSFHKSNNKIKKIKSEDKTIEKKKTSENSDCDALESKASTSNENDDIKPKKKIKLENKESDMTTSSDDNDEDEEFYHFKIDPNYPNKQKTIDINSENIETKENDVQIKKTSTNVLEDSGFDWTAIEETKDSETETDTAASSNPQPIITFESEVNFEKQAEYVTTDIETISTDNDNDDEEFWHFEIESTKTSSVVDLDKKLNGLLNKSEESEATTLREDDEENTYNEYDTITSIKNLKASSRSKSVLEDEGFDWDFYETDENIKTNEDSETNESKENNENELEKQLTLEENDSNITETVTLKIPVRRNWTKEEGWWLNGEDTAESSESEKNSDKKINEENTESFDNKEFANEDNYIEEHIPATIIPIRRNWTEAGAWWLEDETADSKENDVETNKSQLINNSLEQKENKNIDENRNENIINQNVKETTPITRNRTEENSCWLNDSTEKNENDIQPENTSDNGNNNSVEASYENTEQNVVSNPIKRNWTEDKPWWLDEENEYNEEGDKENIENSEMDISCDESIHNIKSNGIKEIIDNGEMSECNNNNIENENEVKTIPIRRNWTEPAPWWLDEDDEEKQDNNKNSENDIKEHSENIILVVNGIQNDEIMENGKETEVKNNLDNQNDVDSENDNGSCSNKENSNTIKYVKRNWSGDSPWWIDDTNNEDTDNNESSSQNIVDKIREVNRYQQDSEIEDMEEEWIYEEVSEEDETDESYDSEVPPPPPPPPTSSGIPPPPPPPFAPPSDFEKKDLSDKQKKTLDKLKSRPRRRPDWSDMMKEVEKGRKLKHVECNDRSKPILTISKSVTKVDGQFVFATEKANVHNKLLKQIQFGIKLKPTKCNDRSKPVLEGLRKFRRQMTIEEQIQKSESKAVLNQAIPDEVLEDSPDEMDDIDKLRDDLQSTKQMLALELRNKEAQERENKRLLAKIANLEAELANQKGNHDSGGSGDVDGSGSGGSGKVDDKLVKQYKKDADDARKETKVIEKKYSDTAEQLDVAKGQVEEQRRKLIELEKKLMQAVQGYDYKNSNGTTIKVKSQFSFCSDETNELDSLSNYSYYQGIIPSSSSSRRQSTAVGKESSPELQLEESESGEDETEEEKEARKGRRMEREVKFLRAKLVKLLDKEMAAKKEKANIKEAMKKNQNFLKQETKKLKKLEKEVAKMAASMTLDEEDEENGTEKKKEPEEDEAEETESEESETESEEEQTESESEESEPEDASNDKKKSNLEPRVKRHEGRLTALKKTNFLLQTNVDRLQDEINLTREKSVSLQAELDAVVADLGF